MLMLIFIVYAIAVADRTTISIVAPALARDFRLDPVAIGLIFSAFAWGYGGFALPAGALVDRLGAKVATACGLAAWSVATTMMGFAHLVPSVLLYVCGVRLLVGVAESFVPSGGASVLGVWFPNSERGLATSLWASAPYITFGIVSPLMGWVCERFGWRDVFWYIGGSGALVLVLWLRYYAHPLDNRRLSHAEYTRLRDGGASVCRTRKASNAAAARRFELKGLLCRVSFLLRSRQMLVIFFNQYVSNSLAFFLLTWLPVFLVKDKGVSIMQAGLMIGLPGALGAAGAVLSGFLVDAILRRTGSVSLSRKVPLTIGYVMCGAVMLLPFSGQVSTMVALLAVAFFGKGIANLGWTLVVDVAPRPLIGSASGLMAAVGTFGAILTSLGIGAVVHYTGSFNAALYGVGTLGLLGVAALWTLMPRVNRLEWQECGADAPRGRPSTARAACLAGSAPR